MTTRPVRKRPVTAHPVSHVIIGSGFAGLKAAETIRQIDPAAAITIVTDEPDLPYWRPRLPDFVARLATQDKITMRSAAWLAERKIDVQLSTRVERIDAGSNSLTLAGGGALPYDTLLIATGSLARLPGRDIPGSDLEGVVTLRSLSDARAIASRLDKAKKTAVVGGGLLGIELVRAFRERGNDVAYFLREDRFWPQMMDVTAARMVEAKLLERGIELRHEELVKEIRGKGGRVVGVSTTKGLELPCQVVGYAIGAIPATAVTAGSNIKVDKGILVDDKLRTNIPNIYAAGDVAQALDLVHGDYRVNTSVANAQSQGEVAGSNMAGVERSFRGAISSNTMQIYGIGFACSGVAVPPGPGFEEFTGPYPKGGVYKKLVLKDNKLVGALLLGDITEGRAVQQLIAEGRDMTEVKSNIWGEGFDLRNLVAK